VGGAELALRVTPRADAERVGPYAGGVLQVRVTRPPADGEANRAVLRLVARALGVPASSVTLIGGARSRQKRCAVEGISAGELAARLTGLGD
jgi:uncharacterized protein YggU (UPF0235/DUF167 family)